MNSYAKYDIPVFVDEIQIIKEVVRIALNTIFYHRYLGEKQFKDVESSISYIYYIKLDNNKIEKEIEKQLEAIEKAIQKKGSVQIVVNFYQKKIKQYYLLEKLDNLWESWSMFFMLNSTNNAPVQKKISKEVKVREYLFNIISLINDKYDFMPDIKDIYSIKENCVKNDDSCALFPFEVFYYNILLNFYSL